MRKERPHLVIVYRGGKRQHRRDLRRKLPLCLYRSSEYPRRAYIYQKHDSHLPLLFEYLYVGRTQSGRDVPVHIAHVVSELVFAHLAEGHTPAFECRVVFSCKYLMRERFGLNLDFPYLFQEFVFHICFPLLRNFNCIDYLCNYIFGCNVFGLGLVCKAYPVAQNLIAYRPHIFRDDITPALDKGISL